MKKDKVSENAKAWLKRKTFPYRTFILFLAFITLFSTIFSLAFAYMTKYLLNSATDGNADKLWIFSIVMLGLLFLRIGLKTATNFLSEKLRAKMIAELRTDLFAKILRSDYASVQSYHSGDLLNRLTSDIQEVVAVTVGLLPTIVGMITQCVGAVAALMTIDPLFTVIYVICGGILGCISALFRKQVKKRHKELMQADGKFRSFMQESLTSIITLKAYGAENKTKEKGEHFAAEYYQKRMHRNFLNSLMNCVFSTLSNFGLIFAVVWCGVSVLYGNDDYGSILAVILLLMQLQQPLASFSSILPAYYARAASAERLSEIEEFPTETLSNFSAESRSIYQNLHNIKLQDLDFCYDRDDVLVSANAQIDKGEIVCVTGISGAGKSTLFKLLLNVFTPKAGNIWLQGNFENHRKELTAKERDLFAYVPQGNFLFSGTIYENLTFFSQETDENILMESIDAALKTACAEFVYELPDGLQTVLFEGGAGLSEGQLQRLAVARAILSNRPILLLDEATSALDSETEKQLLENVRALQGKTCLIVTHRPAALSIADKILCVERGKIITK